MSTAGPSRGRLHERGEAQDRRSRPRVQVAVDTPLLGRPHQNKEAANCTSSGGSAAARAASVGAVHLAI